MKTGWRKIKLSEVVEQSRQLYEPVKEENLPYLGLEHIDQQTLSINSIGNSSETQSTKKIFKDGDILFGTLRPYFRKVVKPRFNGVCSTDITVLRAKAEHEQGYLFYLIASEKFIEYATKISYGTKMPRTNWEKLSETEWLFPPEPEQKRIASTLSAYDDLIENNTLRIKILEEMARLIYREWFVEFKAPGIKLRKATPEEKKVTGKLARRLSGGDVFPEGWEAKKIVDQFQIALGGTPSRAIQEYWKNGSIPWINSSKVNELRIVEPSEFITQLGYDNSVTKLLPKRTTVLAITGATLGQVSMLEIETCANQSVVGIWDESKKMSEYLYLTIKYSIHKIIKHAGGSAQQHINKAIVDESKIIVPSDNIALQFSAIVKPMFDQIANMLFRNSNLRQTRDLLLPKLISGEVRLTANKWR